MFAPHSHDASDSIDGALESSAAGIRAVKISLLALGATSVAQLVIVLISGSVALLADTIHNFSDALTAIPLWIAFALGTKAATRRYTYGYGRAEDLAGLFVIAMITLSAIDRRHRIGAPPDPPRRRSSMSAGSPPPGWSGSSATNSSRSTASASGVASARPPWSPTGCTPAPTDSPRWPCSSVPVVSHWASRWPTPSSGCSSRSPSWPCCAPRCATSSAASWTRVDPELVDAAEAALAAEPGVTAVRSVKMRWIGHRLHADAELDIDPATSLTDAHRIAHEAEHTLTHAVPKLSSALIHAYPAATDTH